MKTPPNQADHVVIAEDFGQLLDLFRAIQKQCAGLPKHHKVRTRLLAAERKLLHAQGELSDHFFEVAQEPGIKSPYYGRRPL